MLEIVPLKERKNATLRYKWGRVPDPGYQGWFFRYSRDTRHVK
jgi:hypothetical protein